MQGFKSFGDRTVSIKLAPGFTCIVGPNGAGKSNVIDALCFCLGRVSKKTMRAKALSDLIFAGTKTLKPASSATVSVIFDNTNKEFPVEGDELEVTRTVKSDSTSKFKINGKTVTREQLLNILAQGNIDPDGSNQFILQGKIVELTHMNIIERRQFIETLIGLEKYDEMVQNTQKELEKADRDLDKFEAIFKEVSTQLKKYEKEKNDALRWMELDGQIKQHNAELIALKIDKLRQEEAELENKMEEIVTIIQELEQKQSRQKEKIEQENLVMTNLEGKLTEKNAEKSEIEQEISKMKSDLSAKETELKHAKDTIEKLEERKAKLLTLQEKLEEGKSYEDLIQETAQEIDKINSEIEETNKSVDETDAQINEKDQNITIAEGEKASLNAEISKNRQSISSFDAEIKVFDKNIKKAEKNLKKNEDDLSKLKKEGESIEDAILQVKKDMDEINKVITSLKAEIQSDIEKQKDLEKSISEAQKEKSLIEKKMSDTNARVSSIDAEIKLYKKQITELQKKKDNLKKEYERLSGGKEVEEAVKTFKEKENQEKSILDQLRASLEALNNEQKNKEHEKSANELQRRSLENEITDYRTRLSALQTELSLAKKDQKNLMRDKTTLELTQKNLISEIEKIQSNLDKELKREEATQKRLAALNEERDKLKIQIQSSEEEYQSQKIELDGVLQILSILSQDIGGSVDTIKSDIQNASEDSLKTSISTFRSYIDDLVDLYKPIQELPQMKESEIKESIPPLMDTLKLFNDNLDDSIQEIVKNIREANDIAVQQSTANFDNLIRDFIDIIENVNVSLKKLSLTSSGERHKQVQEISIEIENQTKISAQTTSEITKLQTQLNVKKEDLVSTEKNLSELNKKLDELNEKISKGEKEQADKTKLLDDARSNVEKANAKDKELKDFTQQYWIDVKKLNSDIEKQNAVLTKIQDDLRELKDIQRYLDEMDSIDAEIASIENEIENKKNSIKNEDKIKESIKNEIDEAQKKIDALISKRADFTERRKELDSKIEQQNGLMKDALDRMRGLENVQRIINEIEVLKNEISEAEQKIEENKREIDSYESVISEIEGQVKNKESEIEKLKNEKEDLKNQLKELRSQLSDSNTELQKQQKRMSELEQMKQREIEIQGIEDEIKTQETLSADLEVEIQDLYDNVSKKEEARSLKVEEIQKLVAERDKSWERQKTLRDELNEITAKLSGENANLETSKNKKITITEKIEELFKDSKQYGNLPQVPAHETENSLIAKIESAKKDKTALEPVNLKAIEYYEEVKERFDEIDMRRQTLQRERKAIIDSIDRIELEKTRTFMKAYHEINRQFSLVFQKLSPGGSAKMILERPDKPFEGGIQIEARPRGKKISSLDILSGGEKTLVALSFIFAVQTQFPAPFYIMDEIDAALDGPNVHRVSMVIKEFAQQAQFIVISHREENIMNSEMIYGVSQQDGLTSIFSVDLKQEKERLDDIPEGTEPPENEPIKE